MEERARKSHAAGGEEIWRQHLIRLASRRIQNQQNLYPKVPTAVAELLQYSGIGSNMGMGFLRERRVAVD